MENIYSHNLQGFSGYVTKYLLQSYQENYTIIDCSQYNSCYLKCVSQNQAKLGWMGVEWVFVDEGISTL